MMGTFGYRVGIQKLRSSESTLAWVMIIQNGKNRWFIFRVKPMRCNRELENSPTEPALGLRCNHYREHQRRNTHAAFYRHHRNRQEAGTGGVKMKGKRHDLP